ncbi:MAG: ABC transporter ATP-binding protein/permease, partial [Euryarchaeota archaeon]|nr:ABC transporter ATP-binding protein/permease [Euryarchaeota archaeon]
MNHYGLFLRLFSIVKYQIPVLSLGIISDILKYLVTLGIGLLGVELLRMARAGDDTSLLLPIGLLILLCAFLRGFFGYMSSYLCHVGAYNILAVLRDRFYHSIEPLAPARFIQKRTGDLVSIAGNNIEMLELFFAHTISPLITAVVIPIIVFISLFFIHSAVACVYLLFIIFIALLPRCAFHLNADRGEVLREKLAYLHAFLIDCVQGIREILAFSRSHSRYREVMDFTDQYQDEYGEYVRKNTYVTALFILLISGGIITLLLVSSYLSALNLIDPLSLPIVILFASAGFSSMSQIVEISKQLSLTVAGAKRLYDLIDMVPDIQEPESPEDPEDITAEIVVKDVSFRYHEDEPFVLSDVSFTVPKGKTVALVGITGAGKTTISHLIMRFWDPVSGEICIGGYDIRSLSTWKLRDMVAMVTQDIFLLNASIMENIRLGRADATNEEVIAAAMVANIHDFVSTLPDG